MREGDPIPPETVREVVGDVLNRADLRESEPTFLDELIEDFLQSLDFSPGAFSAAKDVLIVIGIVLIVLLILVALRMFFRGGSAVSAGEGPALLVRTRVAELRRLAGRAREGGDLQLALRYLLFALVVGLGQRGNLQYRDSWTNRELLERGRPSDRVRGILAPLIRNLEAKEFGREAVTEADVEALDELCARWLGPEVAR